MNKEKSQKMLSMYIHIPFCDKKCHYCDFLSFPHKQSIFEEYANCLKKEIESFVIKEGEMITSIYIGGGTPSLLPAQVIADLLSSILKTGKVTKQAEITIEVNPKTVTKQKLLLYQKSRINRLSIGLQSTYNKRLNQLGRIHTYEDFLETYELAKEVGFTNINIDLMIGLPNQTVEEVTNSIEKVLKLQPQHISVYSLIIEEGTPFEEMLKQQKLCLPDEEVERKMYWKVKKELESKGYIQYEISNFAKPGYASLHNLSCWNQEQYVGFGLGAHSYYEKKRYSNTKDLEEYLEKVKKGDVSSLRKIHEIQTKQDKEKEFMLLGLRKIEGVNISDFKFRFTENPLYLFRTELNKLVKQQLLCIQGDNICLTNKGLDFANMVWEEFV